MISITLAALLSPSAAMACPTCAVGSSSESGSSLWLVFALIAAPFAIATLAAAAIGYFLINKHRSYQSVADNPDSISND